ncbi:MAG: hypothetical protein AAB373_05180 [Patescibacteria group bacterium]
MTEVSTDSDVKILRPEELPDAPDAQVKGPGLAKATRDEIRREFARVFDAQKGNLNKEGGIINVDAGDALHRLIRDMNNVGFVNGETTIGTSAWLIAYDAEVKLREAVVTEMCAEFGWLARFSSQTTDSGYSMTARGSGAGETKYQIHLSPIQNS